MPNSNNSDMKTQSAFLNNLGKLDNHDYCLTSWLFLRALGVIYCIAFASLAVQIKGLIGSNGILPIADMIQVARTQFALWEGMRRFPTLVWFNSSDAFLVGMCLAGMFFALLLIANILPKVMLIGLWALYLSLVHAGQVFLAFQWDMLLLEVGFLAIFLAPLWNDPRYIGQYQTPKIMVWLMRWLLFRLMFASGMVKILSGDATWLGFTALTYHYETQPLPTPLAWYAHHLPLWMQQVSVAMMYFIELIIPFCFLLVRPLRIIAAIFTIGLQVLILLTGNYTFFNWLTIALCLLLVDDRIYRRILPRFITSRIVEEPQVQHILPVRLNAIFAVFMFVMSLFIVLAQLALVRPMPQPLRTIQREIAPFRLINTYGLFAIMTTARPQIIIEGSYDGETWQAYELRWQPQELGKAPPIVAPHQPRLDWQLWFAALGNINSNEWFVAFIRRLQEGSPDVLRLLKSSPFPPDNPPTYIRAQVYNYTFSTPDQKRDTGDWWQREYQYDYMPVVNFES
jgi:hypothetical protein